MSRHRTNHGKQQRACGTWSSEITAEVIANNSISIDEATVTKDALYYLERRPAEEGRCVIVQHTNNTNLDLTPAPYSARSRVHEYGGGCYCADENHVFFVNDSDQNIYRITDSVITRITNNKNCRYADLSYDKASQRLIAICETHATAGVVNSIVSVNLNNNEITTLVEGNDFYASPRLNSSATQLCWQTWSHPNMPWDGNQLWLADIDNNGFITRKKHIAGSDNISVFQPQWSPEDVLFFISDDTGWWHIYRYNNAEPKNKIQQLTHGDKEFGLPQWVFSQSTYAFINEDQLLCCYQQQGIKTLALLTLGNASRLVDISTPWQDFSSLSACNNAICFIAASSLSFPELISSTIEIIENTKINLNANSIRSTSQIPLPSSYYSQAKAITFKNRHQQTVYAHYYAPNNPEYQAAEGEMPPLIVISHGGPTGQSSTALDSKKQFWTSRGFALLDVNYSGSTGYGKAYRLRLNAQWGLLDVQDCCDAALHAVNKNLANTHQLIIRGSSAGGYTVLSALTFEQIFSAGASYYGISELTSLATDTHKFESRYLDKLIGAYPESKSIYEQRSPINSADQLNCPVIFFQGIEDKVVPKEQAEKMFNLLSDKGLVVAAQYFSGEQHGFRKSSTIIQSLQNELNFYRLVFNLTPDNKINFSGEIKINNIN